MSELIERDFVEVAGSLGSPLCLVGPYLSGDVLRSLRPSRLIVDVEAWVASMGENSLNAFDGLPDCEWRHLKGLHAKLALGPRGALVGSANFTHGGMVRNIELGVRLTETSPARDWFEERWAVSIPFGREDLQRYVENRPTPPPQIATQVFRVATMSMRVADPLRALEPNDVILLVGTMRKFPDRNAADAYFVLLSKLYEELGVPPDDPRLSLHATREGGRTLRVNVNNRVVLTWYDRRPAYLGFTVGIEEAQRLLDEDEEVALDWEFDLVARRPHALHLRLPRPEALVSRPEAWRALVDWSRIELAYSERHPGHRRYHAGAGLVATSPLLRATLLDRAFPKAEGSRVPTEGRAIPLRGRSGT